MMIDATEESVDEQKRGGRAFLLLLLLPRGRKKEGRLLGGRAMEAFEYEGGFGGSY